MKITALRVYQIDLPLKEGRYNWSNGNFVEVFDSTVLALETDVGITGYAECCPLGSAYLPSYAKGVREGLKELAPNVIGLDPRELNVINRAMDAGLRGHPYAKAPIDIACWDILGKATNLPVYTLLGGRQQEKVALYRAISQETPDMMAKKIEGYRNEGYTKFQLKVGGEANDDIARIFATREVLDRGEVLVADANTGWNRHDAARVATAVAHLDIYIEQPCMSYEECLSIRRRTQRPFIMDENIMDEAMLRKALADDAMDAINLKISKVGGLTKARLMRDICVHAGVAMTIEDTWGGDIVTATIAHLAASTPETFSFSATDFNSYGTLDFAKGAPKRENGFMAPSDAPGLGIEPDFDVLGEAKFELRAA